MSPNTPGGNDDAPDTAVAPTVAAGRDCEPGSTRIAGMGEYRFLGEATEVDAVVDGSVRITGEVRGKAAEVIRIHSFQEIFPLLINDMRKIFDKLKMILMFD